MPKNDQKNKILSQLISTTKLLNHSKIKLLLKRFPKDYVTDAVKIEIQRVRDMVLSASPDDLENIDISPENIEEKVEKRVCLGFSPSLRPGINAAGIILHTGLGRAPFAIEAQEALMNAVKNYCTLEIDIPTGKRGDRYVHVEDLLNYLIGTESACIVNNNAAAVLLVLNTLAQAKEVIISRGQLIEIGGDFRMPDVMQRSGAIMVEVGTTNRTHLSDYEKAVTENTSLIQVAHTSNFRIMGFTKKVPLQELKSLCTKHNIPLVEDIGSGALLDLTKYGLLHEPVVQESVKAGVDIVTFSGDKLLGGPQCGIIIGKKEYLEKIKKNPLCRALRCDKMTYAVLEATLKLFLDKENLIEKNPVLHMLALSIRTISKRARRFVKRISAISKKCEISIISGESQIGGGSLPTENIPTKLVALSPKNISVDELAARLRAGEMPVFTRIADDRVLLDFRTVHASEIQSLADAVIKAVNKKS